MCEPVEDAAWSPFPRTIHNMHFETNSQESTRATSTMFPSTSKRGSHSKESKRVRISPPNSGRHNCLTSLLPNLCKWNKIFKLMSLFFINLTNNFVFTVGGKVFFFIFCFLWPNKMWFLTFKQSPSQWTAVSKFTLPRAMLWFLQFGKREEGSGEKHMAQQGKNRLSVFPASSDKVQ